MRTGRRFWALLVLIAGLAGCAGPRGAETRGPGGASRRTASTPQRPACALPAALALADEGRFREAEALLRQHVTDPDGPVVDEYAVALEILRRIRLDFPLTPEQMLERLRREIPDATAADLERWRQQGVLQHRVIDGQVCYFNQAVGNLFRASPEARARRRPAVAPAGAFDLPRYLAQLVTEAEQADGPLIHPVRHRVRYELRVREGHPRLRPGAQVRCWLPFPQEYGQQRDVRLIAADPPDAVVAPSGHPQRTIYFEQTVVDAAQPPRFVAEFEFVTRACVPRLDPAQVDPYQTDSPLYREFTAERPPHIVFTPEVRRLAAEIVGEEVNPLLKARRIFGWVSENIPWCAELEYSTIPNLSAKGLSARRGDCGVQGLVFITLCRAAGIPARWQSGWQTLPGRWNMHDWSEIYIEPWGWLPADASYGLQEHPDPRVREFYCGGMDPYRLIVNLDYGRELHPPKVSFRSEPNDFQRGEIEIDGHNLYYNEWSWDFDVRTLPLEAGMAGLEEAFDALVPDLLQAGKIPGAVLLVGRKTPGGYETWQKSYGYLALEPEREPMPPDALFDLASLTKPIATGTSLMILLEQGRLSLDDPAGKYLADFAPSGSAAPAGPASRGVREDAVPAEPGSAPPSPAPFDKSAVTVRHLMTHTSGMPPYVGAGQQKLIREQAGFPCAAATRAYIRGLDLLHAPGQRVTYSCLNAILCAEIVEAVAGRPLDEFAAEHIFRPLGMTETMFNPPRELRRRCAPSTRAEHGVGAGGFLRGQVHDPLAAQQGGVSGNAGLFSTAADLSRFARMLLNGGELEGVRVLKEETVREMTRVQNPGVTNARGVLDRRGLLWDLYVPDAGDTGVDALFAYGHTGYTGTALRIYPEQGVYVIALTNRVHPDDSGKVEDFRRQVWSTVAALLMGVMPDP